MACRGRRPRCPYGKLRSVGQNPCVPPQDALLFGGARGPRPTECKDVALQGGTHVSRRGYALIPSGRCGHRPLRDHKDCVQTGGQGRPPLQNGTSYPKDNCSAAFRPLQEMSKKEPPGGGSFFAQLCQETTVMRPVASPYLSAVTVPPSTSVMYCITTSSMAMPRS